jgi:DNA primase
MVQEAAREVRRLFDEHTVSAMPKTTGNRGIHLYVRLQPRWTCYEVRSDLRGLVGGARPGAQVSTPSSRACAC